MWLVPLAVVGTLFVIPTAAEIPIVQTLMALGHGHRAGGGIADDLAQREPAVTADAAQLPLIRGCWCGLRC